MARRLSPRSKRAATPTTRSSARSPTTARVARADSFVVRASGHGRRHSGVDGGPRGRPLVVRRSWWVDGDKGSRSRALVVAVAPGSPSSVDLACGFSPRTANRHLAAAAAGSRPPSLTLGLRRASRRPRRRGQEQAVAGLDLGAARLRRAGRRAQRDRARAGRHARRRRDCARLRARDAAAAAVRRALAARAARGAIERRATTRRVCVCMCVCVCRDVRSEPLPLRVTDGLRGALAEARSIERTRYRVGMSSVLSFDVFDVVLS